MDRPIDPGPAFYEGVGRVVMLGSQLLGYAGSVAHASSRGTFADDSWIQISGRVGRAREEMTKAVAARPHDSELRQWWTQTQQVLYERNQLVHSLIQYDEPYPSQRPRYQWRLIQTKDGFHREIPNAHDFEALRARMSHLCEVGYELLLRFRAEYEA